MSTTGKEPLTESADPRREDAPGAGNGDVIDVATLGAVAPVGLGAASLDGHILSANPQLAAILGVSEARQIIGRSLSDFHPEPRLAADIVRERIVDGSIEGLRLDALRADGRELVVRIHARLRTDLWPRPVVVFAVTEDTSTERPAEAQSPHGFKMEAMERFAAGVTHDYNNLLTAIIGEARQLVEDPSGGPEAHESAQVIMDSAKRAADITRQLLVFSRAEAATPNVVDLNEEVRGMEASLQSLLGPGVDLVLRLDPDLKRVRIDPSHLAVVLTNLVRNAADAMEDGGRAVVETTRLCAPGDTDGLEAHPPVPPGEYVSIAVGDTGRGMSQETRRRIFDPFFTTKPRGCGAGLGLTTVYGLVLRASGHLAVISAPGWGSLVRVILPTHREAEGEAVEARPPTPVEDTPPDEPILVVDDEAPVLRVIAKTLRRAGYEVVTASSGAEAQDEIRRRSAPFALVITDIMMPEMKGTELARWVREHRPGSRILFVSGYAGDEITHEWEREGPDAFLPKPFEPRELLDRVSRILGRDGP